MLASAWAAAATQPPPMPDFPLSFNWLAIERDPSPLCAVPELLERLQISRERCDAVTLLTIDRLNMEVAHMTAGKSIGASELADYRRYIAGQFLSRLRHHLGGQFALVE